MTWPRRILLTLAAALLLAGMAMGWLLGTASGLRFVLARVEHASGGALTVQQAEGRLAGPLQLAGVRYRKAGSGPAVRIGRIELDLRARALLHTRVHVLQVRVHDVDVALPTRTRPAARSGSSSLDLRAPVDVVIDDARIEGVRVHRGPANMFVAGRIDLAGAWTGDGIELRPLQVRAPDGRIDLDGRVAFAYGHPGDTAVKFDWKAGGRRWTGDLEAKSDGRHASATIALTRPAAARADIRISTRVPYAWNTRLTVPNGPAAPWIGKTSVSQIAATLQAHGNAHEAHAQGTLDLDATRVELAALDAQLEGKQIRLDRLQLRSPQQPGTLDASGRIDLSPASPTGQLHLVWKDVKIPDILAGHALATHGTLDLHGSVADYRAELDAEAGAPDQPSTLQAQVHGTPGQLKVEQFVVEQPAGRLDARGALHFGAGTDWQLSAQAKDFDPGRLLAGWNGSLDTQLSGSGRFARDDTRAQLKLASLSGTLRGHRVKGLGALALSARKVLSGKLDLRVGTDRLALTGADGARNDLDVQLRIGALGDWLPQARGAVQSRLRVRGTWPDLALQGHVDATRTAWKAYRAAQLSAHFDIADINQPGGTLRVQARDLHAAGFAFASVHVDGHGDARRNVLAIDAGGDPLSVHLALQGELHDQAWKGHLQRLDLTLADQPEWHLQSPAALAWNRGQASLQTACLTAGSPQLCASAERNRDGALHASYRMRKVPLELLLALAGNDLPMRAEGALDGQGDIRRSTGGALSGQARLLSEKGKVFYPDQPEQPLLRYRAFDAQLDLAPRESQLRIGAQLQESGHLDGRLRISGTRHELAGNLRVQLDNLHFVELFTHDVANLQGRLDTNLAFAGTLQHPALRGAATATDLAGEIPALGLKLDQGRVRLSGDDARSLRVDGQVRSGGGTLQVAGTLGFGNDGATDIRLRGQKVQVADIPSATVRLSPDMRLRRNAGVLNIGGTLRVDKADVDLEKLPGGGSTQASPDVVVVDAGEPAARKTPAMPVSTDLRVDLGDHAHVTGYGLDGDLHGTLRVTGRSGQGALGQGQIRIDGTFRAYGQDLHIEQGRLLFASTPLDNPGLDIRAVRKLNTVATVDEGQQVGLQIRGTARRPVLTVFSRPAMDPSDALSYLITGKPLSQVKSGEGSMVGSAAQALGSVTGDLLARNVGARLGISDIGVSSSDTLGTTAFTVGKYLSPRLYLSYGVGLFEPGQVVTLRFILSRRWNFEAQQATNSSRASFNYRYEH